MTRFLPAPVAKIDVGLHYSWIALSNTTIGILMATINNSIVLISLPAIFRGIKLNPLAPGNVSYLLWMLMGYMVVTAVLVVSLGRVGDMFGRVRMYNLGFSQSCPDPSRDSSAAACSPRLTGTWCSWQAR